MQRTSYNHDRVAVERSAGISSTLALTTALVLQVVLARAATETNRSSGSVRERIERIIQSAPVTTNLEQLEIYDVTDHIRRDVVRLTYFNAGSSGSEMLLGQVFNLP